MPSTSFNSFPFFLLSSLSLLDLTEGNLAMMVAFANTIRVAIAHQRSLPLVIDPETRRRRADWPWMLLQDLDLPIAHKPPPAARSWPLRGLGIYGKWLGPSERLGIYYCLKRECLPKMNKRSRGGKERVIPRYVVVCLW